MKPFLQKFGDAVLGTLVGFDRLVFRGYLSRISYPEGLAYFLRMNGVLFKDFSGFAEETTARLKEASLAWPKESGRPLEQMFPNSRKKEDFVREVRERDHIEEGLICTLTAVEPCQSFEIFKNKETHLLEVRPRRRKCLFIYHYFVHPILGCVGARIQTWFPFQVQVWINGREWLARRLKRVGIEFVRSDNAFPWIADFARAQRLMDEQVGYDWPRILNGISRKLDPIHDARFRKFSCDYQWITYQSEWATDIAFRDRSTLVSSYPSLVRHAMTTFGSPDVLRFLGRRLTPDGRPHPRFEQEVTSDLKERPEGIRIKHRVGQNSVKAYDKGSVFRVETTMNDPGAFKIFRTTQARPTDPPAFKPMRKGIQDLFPRVEVSEEINDRYLDALASTRETRPLSEIVDPLTRHVHWKGRRVRALNPWAEADARLLGAVARGEFAFRGFNNGDLRALIYDESTENPVERKKQSAAMTRRIRLLRAHGLVQKMPNSRRYKLTAKGQLAVTAMSAARHCNTHQLSQIAA